MDAILSTLGVPLEADYILPPLGHALRACVMFDFCPQPLTCIWIVAVRDGLETVSSIEVRYRTFPPSCKVCSYFGHLEEHCYLLNKGSSTPRHPPPLVLHSTRDLGCREREDEEDSMIARAALPRCSTFTGKTPAIVPSLPNRRPTQDAFKTHAQVSRASRFPL